ncbi:M14 family metallopeptidase [Granulicella arctica]|uniref:M14 family metallopeptidase n=1 Tax=Granulicella arctica TaxID=940613 RepID=UPI0021E05A28|nr:M14 family metallopeptidase [Granulicella arctica]
MMKSSQQRAMSIALCIGILWTVNCFAAQVAVPPATPPPEKTTLLEDVFQLGLILQDTNGDKIADVVCGHVIVSNTPSAAENAAAANLGARLGYESSALTLPIVIQGEPKAVAGCSTAGANLWVGQAALPAELQKKVQPVLASLGLGEGAVVSVDGGLAFVAPDPVGLLAAANAYAARAPFLWAVPGDKVSVLAKNANAAFAKMTPKVTAETVALVFGETAGVRRAILAVQGTGDIEAVRKLLRPDEGTPVAFGSVKEIELRIGDTPLTISNSAAQGRAGALPSTPEVAGGDTRSLDLAALYSIKGLLTGSTKKPIPSGVVAKLYVPAGVRGIAVANLAARLGLETTGINLPLAFPDPGLTTSQIQSVSVLTEGSPAADHLKDLLTAKSGTDLDKLVPGSFHKPVTTSQLTPLAAGDGELRVVEHGFGKSDAVLIRGDDAGATAALDYAANHAPYLWEPGKRFTPLEDVRDDMRQFFAERSTVGQTTAALYHLDQWSKDLVKNHPGKLASVTAEIDVDEADPGLKAYVKKWLGQQVSAEKIEVVTNSLHAGIKCCAAEPAQHLQSDLVPFHQAEPTFAEDIVLPWEGNRLMDAVAKAAATLPAGQPIVVQAGVSESPEQRLKLTAKIRAALTKAGVSNAQVEVLCAYKQGYSWLMDDVAVALAGQPVAKLKVEFAEYKDPKHTSAMRTESRWVQELYPVDEMLAKTLNIPLANVELARISGDAGPTYRVHAFAADGHEILTRDFSVHIAPRTYSKEFSNYEQINIETGWLSITAGGKPVSDEPLATDTELFWDHYQNETLPRIFELVRKQNEGKPKIEFQPLFDTLRIDMHLSEPDYNLGLDQERISSLESLQEDALFATQNSFYMFGDLISTGSMDYMGRILPVAHKSEEGKDGHVRVEFYAKDASRPHVMLAWHEKADDAEKHRERDLPLIANTNPRLVGLRLHAGADGLDSLTWQLPVASNEDKFEEWRKLVTEEQLERTILSAEQGTAQLAWLDKLHAAGLYKDALAYAHLKQMKVEFLLPLELHPPEHTRREVILAQAAVAAPAHSRPQIAQVTPTPLKADKTYVQWDQPIDDHENEHLMARLATYPGADVYWMGRSYLGNNIWAGDIMLPTPSQLRSTAKETTLKAAIIYSGRQHANEVSSTSHIQRLAEELVTDPERRNDLKKVNVVVHPITNPDGAELAIDLAEITPDNMLHAGYHASLTADVVTAQWDEDPIYPESRTRRQLWEAWLPDAFLNPHGYPSHEWVQPFSEYSAWVIQRNQAELGRAWWIPRGWFTSLNYLGDEEHEQSKTVTYALRDYIVDGMVKAPGVLDLSTRMNARYFRFGQQWDDRAFQQPIYKGIRVYMAVAGSTPTAKSQAFLSRFPDVTYDDGYTEAPDETARGPYLHLVAGAGLAYDHAHLKYLVDGKFKIKRTQKEFFDGVQWTVTRDRPVLVEAPKGVVTPGATMDSAPAPDATTMH